MTRIGNIILLMIVLCFTAGLYAQNVKKTDDGKQAAHAKKDTSDIPRIPVYLGKPGYSFSSGAIPKKTFDALLKQGITARDSAGNGYNIVGFTFSYVERNLFEDSAGRLQIMSDYLSEYCSGDTLPTHIVNSLAERTKQKDTAYFDGILLRKQADGSGAYGKGMKFVITK